MSSRVTLLVEPSMWQSCTGSSLAPQDAEAAPLTQTDNLPLTRLPPLSERPSSPGKIPSTDEMERCDALSLNELGEREGAVERDIRAAIESHHRLSQEFQRRWEESNRKHNEARRRAQHLLFVVQEHMQRAADESVRQEDERDRAAKTEL